MTISRRAFFGTTAAAGVAATSLGAGAARAAAKAAARPAVAAGSAPFRLTLGLASYSMRKQPLDKVIETCQAAGIKFVSLKDVHLPRTAKPEELAAALAKLEAAGIAVTGGGVVSMHKSDDAQIRKDFQYARAAKLPLMVIAPSATQIDLLEKLAIEFDQRVAIHNHGPEDQHFPGPQEVLAAVKKRDKRLGLCMDIGHAVRAGADIVKSVADAGERLFDLHVKDLSDIKSKDSQVEVGKGAIDVVGLFRALSKRKFPGNCALEYEIHADDPTAGIRESIGYMRGVAAAVGV